MSLKARANLGQNGDNPVIDRDVVHQKTHEGELFMANQYDASVTNNVALETLIVVPASTLCHLRVYCPGSGGVKIDFFKSTTVTAAGSAMTAYNTNQNSSKAATVVMTKAPTLTDSGTSIFTTLNPGGYGINSANIFGGAGEHVIPAGNYLLRTTNISGSAAIISQVLQWYETGG